MTLKKKFKIIIIIALILIILGGTWAYLVSPVSRKDKEGIEVEIKSGIGTEKIADTLKEKGLIKSKLLFIVYVKTSGKKSLKADTYLLNKSMSLKQIVKELEEGSDYNPSLVKLTFKEGERITDYAKVIANNTNNSYDDVIKFINDKEYIKTLITKYWFLTDKILDENIYYPLEGYLAADTYYFDDDKVDTKDIIKRLLDKENDNLEKYKSILVNDPHYYITMASVVQLEGTNTENRKKIVGTFKNRLSSGYNMGSDVTTYYALQVDMKEDLSIEQFMTVNPYNTRAANMINKMPIGPICNPSMSSIEASVYPEDSNYLFFVADKHGNIYFTNTNAEHDKKVAEIKAKGDWIF